MSKYFEDEAPEIRELINSCMDTLAPEVRADCLVNCLVLKYRQGMTVKQIFEDELKSKKDFEDTLKK